MADEARDRSGWAIGGCLLIGMGVGFFFLRESPMAFVGSMFAGLGVGLVVASLLSSRRGGGRMRAALALLALLLALAAAPLAAEGPGFQDELLDRFTGEWVLQGTIAGGETTHDISAEWVLGHHYLRFHEVARETEADGSPAYAATVYIGWDPDSERYVCLWLDTTGGTGLNPDGFGYAKRQGDALPFLWEGGDDGVVFHTTFSYERESDAWRWTMDSERDGEFRPFARATMRRR